MIEEARDGEGPCWSQIMDERVCIGCNIILERGGVLVHCDCSREHFALFLFVVCKCPLCLQVSFLVLNVCAARQLAAREVEGDARELCFQFAVLESRYVATNQCLPEPPSCPEVG